MNERIKQLAEQAAGNFTQNFKWDYLLDIDKDIFEKFAELIVLECMEVASPNYMSTPEDSVYYVKQAVDRIAEHFGVE